MKSNVAIKTVIALINLKKIPLIAVVGGFMMEDIAKIVTFIFKIIFLMGLNVYQICFRRELKRFSNVYMHYFSSTSVWSRIRFEAIALFF